MDLSLILLHVLENPISRLIPGICIFILYKPIRNIHSIIFYITSLFTNLILEYISTIEVSPFTKILSYISIFIILCIIFKLFS